MEYSERKHSFLVVTSHKNENDDDGFQLLCELSWFDHFLDMNDRTMIAKLLEAGS